MQKVSLALIGVLCMMFAGCDFFSHKADAGMSQYTKDVATVAQLFPKTVSEIEQQKCAAIKQAEKAIAGIIAIEDEKRTFANTFRAYDLAHSHFQVASSCIALLRYVSPDDALREASDAANIVLADFAIDFFGYNVPLYTALKAYAQPHADDEQLTAAERYYMLEVLSGFKRSGLELSQEKQTKLKTLEKELTTLSLEFSKNIATDASFMTATKDELKGLQEDFIAALPKTDEGAYKLGVDYPTYFTTMEFCTVASTRKQMYELFVNRAYPQNKPVLEQIIAKRDALATILGYSSYAALNLDDEMVKTPERAQAFISALLPKAQEKERREFAVYTKDLPESVALTIDGKIQPWDSAFITAYYKNKYYNLDERLVAEYFPIETTLKGLLAIYQSFFNLEMEYESLQGLWYDDVGLIKVYRKGERTLIGYLFLDLYPRPNKFSHACAIPIVPATKEREGRINPAVAVVIANFPKSTAEKPALLKRSDVSTFFHEFGHAIHAILGATEIVSFSGLDVKKDFVEMPSQMLEYWFFERDILKMVSRHYKTGEPLPDHIIDTIVKLKNFNAGALVTRQLFLAQFALDVYGHGAHKDLDALLQHVWEQALLFSAFNKNDHFYASFGHLPGYAARYYGYMWSKVFAADLFSVIKPYGLLNPEIGTVYAEKILAPGGSADPNELLKNFLGREPNEKAFLEDLGL